MLRGLRRGQHRLLRGPERLLRRLRRALRAGARAPGRAGRACARWSWPTGRFPPGFVDGVARLGARRAATWCSPTARSRCCPRSRASRRARSSSGPSTWARWPSPRRRTATPPTSRSRRTCASPARASAAATAQKRRQTFEPTPLGFSIQNAETGCDESHARQWHVDKAAFKAAGGDVVATSSTESPDSGAADFDNVTVGELKLGQGTIRIAGALLPQPSTEFDHPAGHRAVRGHLHRLHPGLQPDRLHRPRRRAATPAACARPGGSAASASGGPRSGRKRARQRRVLGGRLLSRRGRHRPLLPARRRRCCGSATDQAPAGRAAASADAPAARARLPAGIKVGARVRALRRKLRGERRVQVGPQRLVPGRQPEGAARCSRSAAAGCARSAWRASARPRARGRRRGASCVPGVGCARASRRPPSRRTAARGRRASTGRAAAPSGGRRGGRA